MLGSEVAEILKHRLADLVSANSTEDLVAGRPRLLEEANRQHMTLDLCDGQCIVFCANHPRNPLTESGEIDWSRVSRIKILRVEEDHG